MPLCSYVNIGKIDILHLQISYLVSLMGAFSLAILYEYSLVNAAIVLLLQGFLGMVTSIKVKQQIKLYVSATVYAIGMIQTILARLINLFRQALLLILF